MKRLAFAALLAALISGSACGGSTPTTAPTPQPVNDTPGIVANPELSAALTPLAWILGSWEAHDGHEHWTAAGGALFGVGIRTTGDWEVMIIDDGEGAAAADGVLRFVAYPTGKARTEFKASAPGGDSVTFANPEHDAPKVLTYERTADGIQAVLDANTPATVTFAMKSRGPLPPAPEAEAADRATSADAAAKGIDGFMAHVAPDGHTVNRAGEIVDGDKFRGMWSGLLAEAAIDWAPIASGLSGDLAYTVGKATFTDRKTGEQQPTVYVTIWKRQPDGTWKMHFDVGRIVNAPTPP